MSELQNTLDAYTPGTTVTLAAIHSDGAKATRSLKLRGAARNSAGYPERLLDARDPSASDACWASRSASTGPCC